MSFLTKYCNQKLDTKSPVLKTFELVSDWSSGVEVKSFQEVDYPKIVESHGTVDDWSLESLMKAGINPNFSIHTAIGSSRIDEATSSVSSLESVVDGLFNLESKSE